MNNQKLQFYINKNIYDVNIVRTNNKNMYFKIKNQQLVVSAPTKISLTKIENFVNKHIEKFVLYLKHELSCEMINIQKNYFYMFGTKYYYKIITGFLKNSMQKVNNIIYINLKNGDEKELSIFFEQYFKQQLSNYLGNRIKDYEKVMGTAHHSYRIINKNTNWASNSIKNKNLSFAIKLVHYDLATIDYVIVHELAHDFEPNHSSNFWKIVQFYYPQFLEARKKLRNLY